MKNLIFFLALFISNASVIAQIKLIKADGFIDVNTSKLIKPANILIEDNIIKSINPKTLPNDIETIDLSGKILLPGLMDMHVHLDLDFENSNFDIVVKESSAKGALRATKNAQLTLMAGFTTVRNLGQLHPTYDLVNVALSEASVAGWISAPRIIPSGHSLTILGGHGDLSMGEGLAESILELDPERGVISGVDDAIKATRYQIKHGAKTIKIHATAGVMSVEKSVGAQQLSDAEMRAIVEEADRHGIPVAAHAHGTEGIKAAIRAGVASIEHGSILDDEAIQMLIDKNVILVPTSGLGDKINIEALSPVKKAKAEYTLPLARKWLTIAIEEGVAVAIGSDAPLIPHGQNSYEIIAMIHRGMKPAQALHAATMIPAQLVNMSEEIGQIKEGMFADIIAVNEDPLKNIKTLEEVKFVMKDGVIYKNIK